MSHDFAALSFYVGGSAAVEQRIRWELNTGDVLIVPPGERHRIVDVRQADVWGLGFYPSSLPGEERDAIYQPFERVRDGAAPVVRVPPERHRFLAALFEELHAGPVTPANEPVRRSLLTLILAEVARAAALLQGVGAAGGVVANSLRYIERHCLRTLTPAEVAGAVNRTPSYLTTALTRATGLSAGAWIIAGRMAEARRRLLHSDERVDAIAERIGYADVTHFIRTFRRSHGLTPASWRARSRTSG